MTNKIEVFEKESQLFNPFVHFKSRIQEIESKSSFGAKVAKEWAKVLSESLIKEKYPVVHPIGQETFSLYKEYPTGVYEYALDIDGATRLIKEKNLKPITCCPSTIINSVDEGNINKDPTRIKYNHKNPVMVLQSVYLTENKPYCVNGNHRIFEANKNKDNQIEVYVFKDLEFVPFFYDTLSKANYFLEMDYNCIVNNHVSSVDSKHDAFVYEFLASASS
ncbi:hypothetical protein ACFSCX_13770 [Bacillus salitolerans]|uniref:Uncharacterized protein n=1 Tax=Bacillus salitolerans TaxID=1437434 RepID=A0ABW4LRC8_9BACI